MTTHSMPAMSERFLTDTANLPQCAAPETVELTDGEAFDLGIGPVVKQIGEASVRMLAYNGSIPGPTLKVVQGSEITVRVNNGGDLEGTVHWHGLRVENRFDGTDEVQQPIAVGESFTYKVRFVDPGVYWYHPHIREDYGQEMGLYGNVVVVPREKDYWPPVNREIALTLDDILIEHGEVAPFYRSEATHAAMGRFGNVLLTSGKTDLTLTVQLGEVVRFYLTNTANTRVFNVLLRGARMKLVGGDSGRYEQEQFVDEVLLAPSERAVVDVLFEESGLVALEHHTPNHVYPLAAITVTDDIAVPDFAQQHRILRQNHDLTIERNRIAPYLTAPPDKTLAFIAEMDLGPAGNDASGFYVCPMHPKVVSDKPGRCPQCGMKLVAADTTSRTTHQEHAQGHHGQANGHEPDGIEWEDEMAELNRMTNPRNMRWKIVDRETGAENRAIDWNFQTGDRVKIRLINETESDHPMHHPFHIHGAGRFLVLTRDGVVESNLVWKDTVLVRAGQTVDLLLDVSNPGQWMAHCHISEHHESGMMFSFRVATSKS